MSYTCTPSHLQGDSGGPLQFPALQDDPTCMFRVAGVVSFGPPCGIGLPGVYTKVAPYVPWIEKIVWTEEQRERECLPYTGPGTVARRGEYASLGSRSRDGLSRG